jgi:hypothetical protein
VTTVSDSSLGHGLVDGIPFAAVEDLGSISNLVEILVQSFSAFLGMAAMR